MNGRASVMNGRASVVNGLQGRGPGASSQLYTSSEFDLARTYSSAVSDKGEYDILRQGVKLQPSMFGVNGRWLWIPGNEEKTPPDLSPPRPTRRSLAPSLFSLGAIAGAKPTVSDVHLVLPPSLPEKDPPKGKADDRRKKEGGGGGGGHRGKGGHGGGRGKGRHGHGKGHKNGGKGGHGKGGGGGHKKGGGKGGKRGGKGKGNHGKKR